MKAVRKLPSGLRMLPLLLLGLLLFGPRALAGGGPLGIDHRLARDNKGIWRRSDQLMLGYVLIGGEIVGGLWEGGETQLGRTYWSAIDASLLGGIASGILKPTFSRERPHDTSNPNRFFAGNGNASFPSGEVTATAAIVTPFVLEYGPAHPWVWSLELLPAYMAEARMKTWGHWQTDVLAGFALGTAAGVLAHDMPESFTLGLMPDGVAAGFRTKW